MGFLSGGYSHHTHFQNDSVCSGYVRPYGLLPGLKILTDDKPET